MSLIDIDDYANEAQTIDQTGSLVEPPKRISQLPAQQQFAKLKAAQQADARHLASWRAEATELLGFLAGDQLSADDRAYLEAKGRPHIVFNRVLTIMKAIAGMEINGRHEIQFLPRNTEDTAINELLTGASKWMADGTDAEDEESQAFYQAGTVGLGVLETRFSYEDSSEGDYVEEMIDCREFGYDRSAKKKNLKDARRMWRVRKMPLGDAMRMFPGKSSFQLNATWADTGGEWEYPEKSIEQKRVRTPNEDDDPFEDTNEVTIVHIMWYEHVPYYLVADPVTNQAVEMEPAQYERLTKRAQMLGMEITAVEMTRKKYFQAFLGNELLRKAQPSPIGDRFLWSVITGELDAKKRVFFGLMRVMKDPQMWANRFLSQVMHILNSTAKGGLLAEVSAFEDQTQAEESYAMADEITWLADGALSGDGAKIQAKPGAGDPSAYANLMTFAISSIKDVTGINLELLGQQDQNQPGIVESMRKQAGMTVLATMFDALRGARKMIGRARLYIIQRYMSDGRLIRIVGEEGAKVVPLLKDQTVGEYDVIVDDAPTSPNQKEANWAIIAPMLPVFKDQLMGNPMVLAAILEYSPLPAKLVDMIKQLALQQQNDPQAQQQKEIMQQLTVQGLLAKVKRDNAAAEKDNSTAMLNVAKVPGVSATANYENAMAENLVHDNQNSAMQLLLDGIDRMSKVDATKASTALTRVKALREHAAMRHDAHEAGTRQIDTLSNAREAGARIIGHLASARRNHAEADRADRDPMTPAAPAAAA